MTVSQVAKLSVALFSLVVVSLAAAENLPPMNPYLANSTWPKIHGGSDSGKVSRYAGPTVKSHALRANELKWKPLGPFEMVTAAHSAPYPDGRRTLTLGLQQNIIKLDADTLETLATYSMHEGKYFSADEIDQFISRYDKLATTGKRQELYDLAAKYLAPTMQGEMGNVYAFVNNKNERLVFSKDSVTGKRYLRFYGDAVEGDATAAMVLKRQWEIPSFDGKPFIPFAADMTYDGWIVVVSNTGRVLAVANDFTEYRTLNLAADDDTPLGSMQSFVRNGISLDNNNGIYIVTKNFMARVQWTGKELTMDPASGAWKTNYPSGARGSGTTPALMGWGGNEDHLVVVADGTDDDPHLMVFWRDAIPVDWKGIEGYDRRVAGVAQAMFAPGKKALARIENSPPVKGYGVFAAAETPSQPVPPQDSGIKQFIAEGIAGSLTGSEAVGGTKWEWDPLKRELRQAWMTPLKLNASICTPSVNDVLYCIGRRAGQYTLEGIDWNTGKPAVHYTLGKSFRYFSYNNLVVAPNGAVDLFNWMGLTRMQPKK